MRATRWLAVPLVATAVLAGALARAQSQRAGGAVSGGQRLVGTVISADIPAGTIEADVRGRRITLYPIRATTLLKREEMRPDELAVGDWITVTGVPTRLTAHEVTAEKALQPELVDVVPVPAGQGRSADGRQAYALVSGKVVSADPLVISAPIRGPDGEPADVRVEVFVAEGAVVDKLVAAQWSEVREGMSFEFALQDDDWHRMVLSTLVLNAKPLP